jgi:hypothetical protein
MMAILVFLLAMAGLTLLIMYRRTRFVKIFVGLCAGAGGLFAIFIAALMLYVYYWKEPRRLAAEREFEHDIRTLSGEQLRELSKRPDIEWEDSK